MKSFILMVIAMVCVVSLEAQNKSFYDCKHSINSPFHSKNVILLL